MKLKQSLTSLPVAVLAKPVSEAVLDDAAIPDTKDESVKRRAEAEKVSISHAL